MPEQSSLKKYGLTYAGRTVTAREGTTMRSPRKLSVTLFTLAALCPSILGAQRHPSADASYSGVNRSFVPAPPPLAVGLASDPATISTANGRIDVFARGSDDALWHIVFANNQWSAWESRGGQLASGPAVVSAGADRVDVFARSAANQLLHLISNNGQWSQWQTVGTFPPYPLLTSDPSAVSFAPGRIEVFYRGPDGALWTIRFDGLWRQAQSLGNQLAPGSGPAVASLLATPQNVFNPPAQRLNVFIRGADNALHRRLRDDNGWHGWQSLGGALTADPSAVSRGGTNTRIDVFFRGTDNALYHRRFDGYTWHNPQALGGQLTGGPDASGWGPAGGPDLLNVFVRGTDNALHYRTFNGYQWLDWQTVGSPPDPVPPVNPADVPCPATPVPAGVGFRICASPGETPGFNMGEVWTFPGPIVMTSTIRLESVGGYAGTVTLSAACCFDVIRQRSTTLGPPGPVGTFSPNPVSIPANGSVATTLTITVPTVSAVPPVAGSTTPSVPYGKFNMSVEGKDAVSGLGGFTYVGMKKVPATEAAPACRPSAPLLPTGKALEAQIKVKETNPLSSVMSLPMYRPPPHPATSAFQWTITDDPSLPPGSADVVLENTSGGDLIITSVGCSGAGPGKTLRVPGGRTGTMRITRGVDNTLIFRHQVWFGWRDWGVLSQPAFWGVVAGKKNTFRWFQ